MYRTRSPKPPGFVRLDQTLRRVFDGLVFCNALCGVATARLADVKCLAGQRDAGPLAAQFRHDHPAVGPRKQGHDLRFRETALAI